MVYVVPKVHKVYRVEEVEEEKKKKNLKPSQGPNWRNLLLGDRKQRSIRDEPSVESGCSG